ncbi:MAG: hypothetical protein K2N63_05605 [Lachnospiraceae bacterium]|nr:hypothetical protein [Lachnospiraceae bacterium]
MDGSFTKKECGSGSGGAGKAKPLPFYIAACGYEFLWRRVLGIFIKLMWVGVNAKKTIGCNSSCYGQHMNIWVG